MINGQTQWSIFKGWEFGVVVELINWGIGELSNWGIEGLVEVRLFEVQGSGLLSN